MKIIASIISGLALVAGLLAIPAPASPATCGTGPYQSYVEKFLGLPVNGVASQADCDKVASWQMGQRNQARSRLRRPNDVQRYEAQGLGLV